MGSFNDIGAAVVCGVMSCVMILVVVLPILYVGRQRRRRYREW